MKYLSLNIQGLRKEWKQSLVKNLCIKHHVTFLALQEMKMRWLDLKVVRLVWGNLPFDFQISLSKGLSGGMICVCDNNLFSKSNSILDDYVAIVEGIWRPTNTNLLVASVYAPQDLNDKKIFFGSPWWFYWSLAWWSDLNGWF